MTSKTFVFLDLLLYFTDILGLLFFIGWLFVGVGLKPRGSTRIGLLAAATLYIALGLIYFTIRIGVLAHPGILKVIRSQPISFLLLIRWPLEVLEELRTIFFRII